MVDGVLSMSILWKDTDEELPTLSLQLPITDWSLPSALSVTGAVTVAGSTPEAKSVQVKLTWTLWFVQVPATYGLPSPVMMALALMAGAVVSRTVIVKVAVPVFPAGSDALHVTVVFPSGNVLPETGVQITGTPPLSGSLAAAVKLTAAPVGLVASATIVAGTVMTGGVVSGKDSTSETVTASLSMSSAAGVNWLASVTVTGSGWLRRAAGTNWAASVTRTPSIWVKSAATSASAVIALTAADAAKIAGNAQTNRRFMPDWSLLRATRRS